METKACKKCGEARPLEQYHTIERRGKVYRIGTCLTCRIDKDRRRRQTMVHVPPPLFRVCTDCGIEKPITAFRRQSDAPDGYRKRCNPCWKLLPCRSAEARQKERRKAYETRGRVYMTRAERAALAASRQSKPRRLPAPERTLYLLLRRLLADRCAAEGVSIEAARYRVRYRLDPEFRAKEILRRQARDYTLDSDGTLTPAVVRRLFAEATQCPYCERPMHPRRKTLDHIIPRSRGGKHSITNVLVCCLSCNSSKNDRTLDEWRGAA